MTSSSQKAEPEGRILDKLLPPVDQPSKICTFYHPMIAVKETDMINLLTILSGSDSANEGISEANLGKILLLPIAPIANCPVGGNRDEYTFHHPPRLHCST